MYIGDYIQSAVSLQVDVVLKKKTGEKIGAKFDT